MSIEQTIQQIIQAIDLANNPSSQSDLKTQALQYLNEVKTSNNASQTFVELIKHSSLASSTTSLNQANKNIYKFVGFQTLAELIPTASPEILQYIKSQVIEYVNSSLLEQEQQQQQQQQPQLASSDPEYIRNKISEIFAELFYFMYGDCNNNLWSTFYQDLLAIFKIESIVTQPNLVYNNNAGLLGLDYFLRICLQINTQVADQTFVSNKQVQMKNNSLKDTMRMNDVSILSTVWLNVLLQFETHKDIINLTLTSIGNFVSWIDINLIIQPQFINAIFKYLDNNTIPCCTCLSEIISKKMKPNDKLQLLQLLNLTDKISNFFNTNKDMEILENLSKLVNAIGVEYTIICENNTNNTEYVQMADASIMDSVCPLILQFLAHEEFLEVNIQTFQFLSNYLSFLKKSFALGGKPGSAVNLQSKQIPIDEKHLSFCKNLLIIIHNKLIINDDFDIDSIEEINEYEENFRSKIKNFQDSVAIINPDLYLNHMVEIISNNGMLFNKDNSSIDPWRIKELFIYQLHNYAESIRNNLFGIPKNQVIQSKPFLLMCEFIQEKMLKDNSNFQYINNPWIQISYFELLVRHHNFLLVDQTTSNENILFILNIFASDFGIFNQVERVRFRTWFLFSRFIKLVKPSLDFQKLVDLLTKISPLLVINVLPTQQAATNNTINEIANQDANFENQLYLFEGTGILVSSSKSLDFSILDGVLSPLFRSLEVCIGSPVKTASTVLEIHHILMSIGTLARGIHTGLVPENLLNNSSSNEKLSENQSLIEVFSNIAEVVLVTFQFFHSFEIVRDSTRFVFARLISILNTNIISFISRLLATFYESDLKVIEMNDFLGFVGQVVHTFQNNEECYQLLNSMITPLVKKVFKLIEQTQSEAANLNGSLGNNSINGSTTTPSPSPELSSSVVSNMDSASKTNISTSINDGTSINNSSKDKNVVVTDAYRDTIQIKKGFYNFIQSLVTNHVTSLLLSESNKNSLSIILNDLLEYTPQDLHETSAMKIQLNVLINLVKYLGTGTCVDTQDVHSNSLVKLDGLNEFFVSKIVPLVFEIPFKPEFRFDIKDASYRVVASDLSRLLKACYMCNVTTDGSPNALFKYLNDYYFPQIQFPSYYTMEFMQALEQLNEKKFEAYYVQFITKLNQ